jgi:hypothetical protein
MAEEFFVEAKGKAVLSKKAQAEEIDSAIKDIRDGLKESFLDMCQLLAQLYNERLYHSLGYTSFNDYVAQAGLDLNVSVAYRMVKFANTVEALQIPKEKLLKVKPSKLLEIASLDREENKSQILDLINDGENMNIHEVREKVRKTKGLDATMMMTFKVERSTYEEIITPAFEKVRQVAGSTVDEKTGEVTELTDSRVLEFLCAEYLHTPVDGVDPFLETEED